MGMNGENERTNMSQGMENGMNRAFEQNPAPNLQNSNPTLGTSVNMSHNQNFTSNGGQGIDYNHPLFLNPTYVSGVSIISFN